MLATGTSAVDPHALRRRYSAAAAWGAFGATLLMAIFLGVREDLSAATRLPMFWVKLAFPVALAASALIALARLSRPGMTLARLPAVIAAPVIAVWLIALVTLVSAQPGERTALVFGDTWAACLVNIPFLSVPAWIALAWALRAAAPTRPALTGGTAGLAAGALGAAVYALHCPEIEAPFIGLWYVLGMLIPAGAGAIAGSRLLRW